MDDEEEELDIVEAARQALAEGGGGGTVPAKADCPRKAATAPESDEESVDHVGGEWDRQCIYKEREGPKATARSQNTSHISCTSVLPAWNGAFLQQRTPK